MAQSLTTHLHRFRVAYAVLVFGLLSTALTWDRVRENVRSQDRARFERIVSESEAKIERGFTRCVDQMYNIRALFAASKGVEWEDWQAYLGTMRIRHSQLGIRSLGYIEPVSPTRLETFLKERAAAGQPEFTIIPPGERTICYPAIYLTHFDSTADVIIGIDHAVQSERRTMIERAISENKPSITQRVNFIGRDGAHTNFGVFVYLPMFRKGSAISTPELRREAVRGLVYMAIEPETLPGILFQDQDRLQTDLEVFDGPEISPEKLLYSRSTKLRAPDRNFRPAMSKRISLTMLNREWTIFFFTTSEFEAGSPRYLEWLALVCGLTLSFLLFAITFVQVNARARAERDAAELHKSEGALAGQKERLVVTLDSIADGVITTDAAGKIISINPAAERLTGWLQKEAEGRPLDEVFHAVHALTREPRVSLVEQVLRTGISTNSENDAWLKARDGSGRIVTDSAAPIHKENEILGAVLVFRDVTEKRKNEEEMARESKLESVGLLAGGIAHDFNNILTGIIGNISLARMSAHSTDKMLERLAGVEKSAQRARDLTQQLLTFAKGGAPIRKWTQLPELIKDVCQFTLHGSTVECEYSLPAEVWPVELDEGQFRQALNHLVINAMQAMPDGGQIEVKLENVELTEGFLPPLAGGRYVKLSIRDHGAGIQPETVSRIFEPYFGPRRMGNGLGLATAYSVVRKHDGQIRVESSVGVGSVFQVYLPVSHRPVPAAGPDQNQKEFFGHGRVLIMDDEPDVLGIAADMLKMCGYEVETVRDGAEMIEQYLRCKTSGRPFDVVIVDLTVPNGMGGREAIRRLKELAPEVKAIVSSGYSFDPVMANYRQYGFRGIIPKPYRIEELGRVLSEVLNGVPAES